MKKTAQEEYGFSCILQLASMAVGAPLAGSERRHPLGRVVWYNRSRMHSTLGYLSPAQFGSKQTPGNTPSQPNRDGSTATGRKSKASKLMTDVF